MTIAALLITKTPSVICACLVLMYVCFLYAVLSLAKRKFPDKLFISVRLFAIPALLVAVGAFGWWVWPHEVTMTYTNTAEFSFYRRLRIQVAADSYSSYLKGIGFDVPMAAPVLGVASGRVHAGLLPGLDVFRMTIAREDLNHPNDDLMAAYGFYIVSREIHESSAGNDPDSKERISDAIWLFANYYRCSFNGELTDYYHSSSSIERWNDALWELRAKYGAVAMNKAMFVAIQQWKPFGFFEGDVNFNNYYSLRILAGIKALDNNTEDPGKDAQLILEQKGLYTPNLHK